MGYLNDVVLVLNKAGIEELDKKLAELPDDDNKELVLYWMNVRAEYHYSGDFISRCFSLRYWHSVEWHTADTYVNAAAEVIYTMIYSLPPENYLFIRIGEDYDDVERSGLLYYNPYNVHIRHTIEFEL